LDRVTDITKDCFNAIAQLRAADRTALPSPERIHARLRAFVDDLLRRASAAGLGREEANELAYPVVALADEVILDKDDDALRAYWTAQPLQLHFFGENVAGEAFFDRLERARRDPRRAEALRVFYLALVFGFRGRYRVRGGDLELLGLTEALAREVTRGGDDGEGLSPQGDRPPDRGAGMARNGLVLWIGLGLLVASAVLYLTLRFSLGAGTAEVVDRIAAFAKR
jgi:type VI secretion system protein ImpK